MNNVSVLSSACLILFLAACSDGGGGGGGISSSSSSAVDDTSTAKQHGQYSHYVPESYSTDEAAPLLLLLHGYSSNANAVRTRLQADAAAEKHGFVAVYPQGVTNSEGDAYWNANDTCCQDGGRTPDDVAYLTSVIDEMADEYNIDPERVYIIGHSNGGSMGYRMACDASSKVAAVVSVAGPAWYDASQCAPEGPVSVVHVHGTLDDTVFYDGGTLPNGNRYNGALDAVSDWADRNGCTGMLLDAGPNLDFDQNVAGDETRVQAYEDCPAGIGVELWSMQQSDHFPLPTVEAMDRIWAFLEAYPNVESGD